MNIATIRQGVQKIKAWTSQHPEDLFVAALIFLVGLTSFGLGRLSVLWPTHKPIRIETIRQDPSPALPKAAAGEMGSGAAAVGTSPIVSSIGQFVASKSGSAYHFPWCPGALRIKEENKIWFNTAEEAESQGYRPAKNCPGL